MKFKLFYLGTTGLVDMEAINRIVVVNKMSVAFGVALLAVCPTICYFLNWQSYLMVPLTIEFVLNGSVLLLNYIRWHKVAALMLYFLQVGALIYFSSKLGKLLDLELAIILLIALVYLIFKEHWLRMIAVSAAFCNLVVLEYSRYFDGKHPSTELSYDQRFITHCLVISAATGIIFLISKPYVKSNDTYNELQKAKHFITLFVAQVTHELRTPLDNIHQVAQLLKKEVGDEESRKSIRSYADISFIVSSHAKNIVNNVLSMSEIETGKIPSPAHEPIEVVAFFDEIMAVHKLGASIEGMGLRLELDMPETIKGDRLGINQIVSNLVSNAIKYGSKDGIIMVSAKRQGSKWELKVSNPGPGIPRQKLGTIFDSFVRGKAGQIEGSGLGLYIVKSKVMQLKGTISVESEPGQSTTFTVILPLEEVKKAKLPVSKDAEPELADLSGMQVVVAEDNKLTTVLLSNFLKNMGCSYSIVNNGQDLVEMVAKKCPYACPDVIILDGNMPILNGEQTIRRLKELPGLSNIPIIVTTGDIYSGTVARMLAAGANTYVKKPIEYHSLQKAIGSYSKKSN